MNRIEKFIVSVLPGTWFGAAWVASGGLQNNVSSSVEIALMMAALLAGGFTLLYTVDQLR